MDAFEAFLVAFCHRVILSYKSTFLGLLVAAAVMLIGAAQSYPNHYVQVAAGLILIPFLSWRDQKVKDGTLKLFILAAIFFLPLAARAETFHPVTTEDVPDGLLVFHPLASGGYFAIVPANFEQDATPAKPVTGTLADVLPSDDPAPPTKPQIGGCFASGKHCIGPAIALSLGAINLSKKQVEGAFSPGVGLQLTLNSGQWYSVGIGAYFNLDAGAQNASAASMVSLLNGYLKVGYSKGFIGDTSARLLFGTGIDL